MPHRHGVRRLPLILAFAALIAACEEDPLSPVSGFVPSDCIEPGRCSEGGMRLDGGSNGVEPDSGVVAGEMDASDPIADSGADTDSGAMEPDAAEIDAGTVDTGPPPTNFLDVSGQWQTTYEFDTSEYLFGISGIADEISLVNNAINGNLNTGFPLLDQWIQNIVQQYIPQPVQDIIAILNTIATFSEKMESRGVMTVVQQPPVTPIDPTVALAATELWSELTVYIVDQCPLGRQDPNFPACARFTIPTVQQPAQAGPFEVGVDVKPFNGTLDAIPSSAVMFSDREVEVEMGRLIALIVDTIINLVSSGQYSNLRDLLNGILDCPQLATDAADWAANTFGLGLAAEIALRVLIENQCNDAIDDIVNQVGLVTVSWDAFEYDQHGVAKDFNGDAIADELQLMSVPQGIRDGRFRALISASMEGVWQGIR
jgi:hypothetical protein